MPEGDKSSVINLLKKRISEASNGFTPDIVITFAMQADYIKSIWPNTHVFYAEVGAFSRSPYPLTMFFDHLGMYGKSAVAQIQHDPLSVDVDAYALAQNIRAHTQHTLAITDPFEAFDLRKKFKRLVLLPLQVSNYFSFDDQAPYRTQFEFLLEVLSSAPKDVGIIVTEYIQWGEILRSEGAGQNLPWLSENFPNFIYKQEFREISSPSQYLVAHVDGLITICSNMGFQALLLEKRLGCAYDSYLNNVAHDRNIPLFFKHLVEQPLPEDRLNFLAWYIDLYAVPEQLFDDGHWFSDYMARRVKAIESANMPKDGFVSIASPEVLRKYWLTSVTKDHVSKWETESARLLRLIASTDCDKARLEGVISAQRPISFTRTQESRGKYILLNETRRIESHLHLGCNAVTRFIEESMAHSGLSCLGSANFLEECQAFLALPDLEQVRLVIFNGEGSVHHDNERIRDLMLFCGLLKERGIPCVLINTTWHANSGTLGELLNTFSIVTVRDSISLKEIRHWVSDARLVPDISFAAFTNSQSAHFGESLEPSVHSQLAVIDHVKSDSASNLAAFAKFHQLPFYLMGPLHVETLVRQAGHSFQLNGDVYPRILRSTQSLSATNACITGRFHGMIAAMCVGVPVVAVSSNTPKIEGLLDDMGIVRHVLLPSEWINQGRHKQRDIAERLLSRWNWSTHKLITNFTANAIEQIAQVFRDIDALLPEPAHKVNTPKKEITGLSS